MNKSFCSVLGWGVLIDIKDFEQKFGSLFDFVSHYNDKFIDKRRNEYDRRLYFHYDQTVDQPSKLFITTDRSYALYSENGQQYHIIQKGGVLQLTEDDVNLLNPFGDLNLVLFGYHTN